MDLRPKKVAEKLRETFHDLPAFEQTHLIAEGFSSRVFLLDDEYIFRIAKNADVSKRYERELEHLPRLRQQVPVAIPHPLWYSPDAFPFGTVGYRKIPGVPLTLELTPQVDLSRTARDLAAFMVALHSVSIAPDFDRYHARRERDLEQLRYATLPPLRDVLRPDHFERLTARWQSFLPMPAPDHPIAVLHGDLWAENLILNEALDELVGVVDFEAVVVGDIARDFAPLTYLGSRFLYKVIDRYQALGGELGNRFHERVQDELLLRELKGLQYALKYPEADELRDALRKIEKLNLLTP